MKTQYRLHCKLHCDSFALQLTKLSAGVSLSLSLANECRLHSVGRLFSCCLVSRNSVKLNFQANARHEQPKDRGFKRLIAHVSYGLKLGQHNCNCVVVFHLFWINLRNVNCFCSSGTRCVRVCITLFLTKSPTVMHKPISSSSSHVVSFAFRTILFLMLFGIFVCVCVC